MHPLIPGIAVHARDFDSAGTERMSSREGPAGYLENLVRSLTQ